MKNDVRQTADERGEDHVGEARRLDGNAAAGVLSEIFVPDLTAARATCAYCGAIRALGTLLVYAHPWARSYAVPSAGPSSCVLPVYRTNSGST